MFEDLGHDRRVGHFGDVAQRDRVVGQDGGSHLGQCGVLRTADADAARQLRAASDPQRLLLFGSHVVSYRRNRARRRRASATASSFWNSISSPVVSVPASLSCARRRASSAFSMEISSACSATSARTVTRSGSTSRKPPPTKRISSGPPMFSWIRSGPGLRIVINGAWRASTPSSPSAPLAMMNSTSPSKRERSTLTTRSGYLKSTRLPTRWGGGPDSRSEAGPEGTPNIYSRPTRLPTRWGGGPDSRSEAGPEGTPNIYSRPTRLPTRWGGGPDSRSEAGPEGTRPISPPKRSDASSSLHLARGPRRWCPPCRRPAPGGRRASHRG